MRLSFSRLDLALVGMTLIWGSNFSIVKAALRDAASGGVQRHADADRGGGVRWRSSRARAGSRRSGGSRAADWRRLVGLAIVGHVVYQFLFIGGLARTSASNSSLIFGCTPALVALCSAWLGHERVTPLRWAGVWLSMAGVYLVVGHGHDPNASVRGDAFDRRRDGGAGRSTRSARARCSTGTRRCW